MSSFLDPLSSPQNPISIASGQPKAWVLDVGHGNSAVVDGGGAISVIDGGNGDTLIRFLTHRGITRVDTVIVSHADADHFGGISLLLSNHRFEVGHVYLNPDSRETELWNDFVSVMKDAQIRGTRFSLELTDVNPGVLQCGQTRLEILGPSQLLAYRRREAKINKAGVYLPTRCQR